MFIETASLADDLTETAMLVPTIPAQSSPADRRIGEKRTVAWGQIRVRLCGQHSCSFRLGVGIGVIGVIGHTAMMPLLLLCVVIVRRFCEALSLVALAGHAATAHDATVARIARNETLAATADDTSDGHFWPSDSNIRFDVARQGSGMRNNSPSNYCAVHELRPTIPAHPASFITASC